MTDPSGGDLVEMILERMHRADVTQDSIASSVGVSQGHFSKVLARKTPISRKLEARMRQYLSANSPDAKPVDPNEMKALGADIMQNMQSALTDLQRLCDGISQLAGKQR
jgi:hypothetical protein